MRIILISGGGYPPMKREYCQPSAELIPLDPVLFTGSGEPTLDEDETPLMYY